MKAEELEDSLLFETIDILAHEYGWTINYIQKLDILEIQRFLEKIMKRHREEANLQVAIINHGMAGKQINWDSNKEQKSLSEEEQLKDLMNKLGKGKKK